MEFLTSANTVEQTFHDAVSVSIMHMFNMRFH